MFRLFFVLLLGFSLCCGSNAVAQTRLTAIKTDKAPVVDGKADDPAWNQTQSLTTHDPIAGIDVTLKALYTDRKIFVLARFSDPDESRRHKYWSWNPEKEMYEISAFREDVFVIKWAMDPKTRDLSIRADKDYRADIWYWKANRTDPKGYADDKYQILSSDSMPHSKTLVSRTGKTFYLKRRGDKGNAAYKSKILINYDGDLKPQYVFQEPTGSRSDVRAKGTWSEKQWCIEFSRNLDTGNSDDVTLDIDKTYLFGISRYEIADKDPNPKLDQPLYGSGDVSESLYLVFNR